MVDFSNSANWTGNGKVDTFESDPIQVSEFDSRSGFKAFLFAVVFAAAVVGGALFHSHYEMFSGLLDKIKLLL